MLHRKELWLKAAGFFFFFWLFLISYTNTISLTNQEQLNQKGQEHLKCVPAKKGGKKEHLCFAPRKLQSRLMPNKPKDTYKLRMSIIILDVCL